MKPAAPAPRRLLVRGVNWLGDAVMAEPALDRLRAALPDAEITLLTLESLGGLWTTHPALNRVATFRRGESWRVVARRLRALNCDAALILPNSPRSALEAWAAGIPRRIGAGATWRSFLLTEIVRGSPRPMTKRRPGAVRAWARRPHGPPLPRPPWGPEDHHTLHYLRLASALGALPAPLAPRLPLPPDERSRLVAALLQAVGVAPPPAPWLGVNAGAAYGPAKQWPAERFAAAAREALARGAGAAWVLGGPSETEAGDALARRIGPGAFSLAGRTDLRSLMAILASCQAVVTNDSGPMHLAAAVGTRVIGLFGSTSPELTGPGLPGGATHSIVAADAGCRPCFLRECPIDLRCQLGITVDAVSAAVLRALGLPMRGDRPA